MKWSSLLASMVLIGAIVALILVLRPPGGVRLVPLPDVPDVPDEARTRVQDDDAQWDLTDQLARASEGSDEDVRKRRNELVTAWREALEAFEAGAGRWREAERRELDVWVARFRTGEVSRAEMHRNWARLIEHEHVRVERLAARARATPHDVERVRLYALRERHAAGDPAGAAYPEARARYVAERTEQLELLVRAGSVGRDWAQIERDQMAVEFPPEA